MCLPDLNWAAARKRWGGTGRWNRDRLMRSAFGGVVGAGGDGMSCRDALGGRRDAAGVSGVSLVLLAVLSRVSPPSAPCAAVGRRVCGLACGVVLCFLHERGARWCSAPRPVVAALGVAQCVAAAGGRSLLSDRFERSGVAYSLTGCCG